MLYHSQVTRKTKTGCGSLLHLKLTPMLVPLLSIRRNSQQSTWFRRPVAFLCVCPLMFLLSNKSQHAFVSFCATTCWFRPPFAAAFSTIAASSSALLFRRRTMSTSPGTEHDAFVRDRDVGPDNKIYSKNNDNAASFKKKKKPAPQQKRNRPGQNSYLKVVLDDATLDYLHGISQRIQHKVQEEMNQQSSRQEGDQQDNYSKQQQQQALTQQSKKEEFPPTHETHCDGQGIKNPTTKSTAPQTTILNNLPVNIKFKPRSQASLHMTFFFGGETLCELSPEELCDWHDKVRGRLQEAGFVLQAQRQEDNAAGAAGIVPTSEDDDKNYWFKVTDICTFPPRRNNLVVAILEASPAWHELHDDIRDLAKSGSCGQALKEITAYNKEKWTAHVTLGNIMTNRKGGSGGGHSKQQVRTLMNGIIQQVVSNVEGAPTGATIGEESNVLFPARVHGIAMGGPIPKQAELDWNFTYVPSSVVALRKK